LTALETARPGASDLLRGLGLLVDGPVAWGKPVGGRGAGVFIVELPRGLADAPVDIVAVRRWLEHVPTLRLDGERPSAEQVARRLHEFWLGNESVLYVGRSAKQIAGRVAAMYATPLGDARPHSGGHWLKTLSVLNDLRVWWAETDAHEEYEDALLAEVGKRNDEGQSSGRALLPFANLVAADGTAKPHGLTNSLRSDAADVPGASKTASRTGTGAAATRTTTRSTTRTTARKPAAPRPAASRPTAQPTFVSREGLEKLQAELENLRTVQRPEIIARVATARSHGDLKENAEYEYARKEQSFMEGRIQMLEQMLRNNVIIENQEASDTVRLGSTVVVESDGDTFTYQIVGSAEANPAQGKLSNNSPVGKALIGASAGDRVQVELPSGSVSYRVVKIS